MKSDFPSPDYRNLPRGKEWLRRMIEEIRSEKDADRIIDEMQMPLLRRERVPGDDDE